MVTGGAGFIGSQIVDLLIERGNRVLVVDNLSTGSERNLNPEAEFSPMDICHPELANLVARFRPQVVIHQAAQVSVPLSIKDPLHDARVNVLGTLNLLEACRLAKVIKVIYASSAALYGEPQYLPVDETHPLNPMCGYGVSKFTGERYLDAYCSMYGLGYTVLRYANVYGPRQDALGEGGVVAIFLNRLLKGEAPVIFGDGEQTRDFVYVKDVATANVVALTSGQGQILNVSTGQPTSVNHLFEILKEITGYSGQPVYALPRTGDIVHSYLNNEAAKVHLKWQPQWNLSRGLKDFYLVSTG